MAAWLDLVKHTHPKTGRVHYTVEANMYHITRLGNGRFDVDTRFAIRKHFGPTDTRTYNSSWKFRNRSTAEQLILLAILKWGS